MEKLNTKNLKITSDENLIEQMKEALYACPSALKFCREQGMTDEVMDKNITKIYDFVRDINYCRKCPGIKKCKKDNAYVISKVTYSYGVVENQLIPCPEILKRVTFERQFLVRDFADEWLDVIMSDINKSKEKTQAASNYMKYLRNEEYNWLYLTGGIGSGKSYLAAAMSIDLAKRGLKGKSPICFINASKRFLELSDLNKQKSDEFKKKLELYSTVPVLIIDDFPLVGDFLGIALGNGCYVRFQKREELVEVVQGVTIERSGERHRLQRTDTVVFQRGEHILGRTALCELAVAVVAYHLDGALHIGLVGYESFAEGITLTCSFQDLSLKE